VIWFPNKDLAPVTARGLADHQTTTLRCDMVSYHVASLNCSLSPRQILLANSEVRSLRACMLALVKGQISPLSTRLPSVKLQFANSIPPGSEPNTTAEGVSTTVTPGQSPPAARKLVRSRPH
jgi:hypothetical protein